MIKIRKAKKTDIIKLIKLHREVAKVKNGIARTPQEISKKYVTDFLTNSLKKGLIFVAENNDNLVAEIHCYKLEPNCFKNNLSNLTIVVHPDFHDQGIGKKIFLHLLNEVKTKHKNILRIELTVRQSNQRAIKIYQSLGFEIEGIMKNRILDAEGKNSGDTMMAWFNPEFICDKN